MPSFHDYLRMFRHSGAARVWRYFRENHLYDLQHGTDTATWKPTKLQGRLPNIENGYPYEATQTSRLRRCLAAARALGYGPDRTFVDLGCGKAKALLVASDAGYGRLVGVEYDPALAVIARSNLVRRGVRGEIVCMDASAFEPGPGPSIVYMFNPFGREIVAKVVERLAGSDVLLIYSNPVHADLLVGWRTMWAFGPATPIGRDAIYAPPAAP